MKSIQEQYDAFSQAVDNTLAGLRHFGIGSEALEANEVELGVLIPRHSVKNSLADLGRELALLEGILGTFSECAIGERPPLKVRTISSSDFQIFLESVPQVAACIAVAIERIVALYEKLLSIRKLKQELQEQDVPEDSLKGIGDHAESLMVEGIDKLVEELMQDRCKVRDEGRRNELETALRFNLKRIADRIDRGYNFEVRAGAADDAVEPEGSDESQEEAQLRQIRARAQALRFRKLEGEPILHLTDENSDEAGKGP